MDALSAAVDSSMAAAALCSPKVEVLVGYLEARQPRKCLLFAKQRVVCRLLSELLHARLRGAWPVGCIVAAGELGLTAGRGAQCFSLSDQVGRASCRERV